MQYAVSALALSLLVTSVPLWLLLRSMWLGRVTPGALSEWVARTGATRVRLSAGQIVEVDFPALGAGAAAEDTDARETDLARAVRLLNGEDGAA